MTPAPIERSTVPFGTRTIRYDIRRSSRRTTVAITVDPSDGSVLIVAPERASIQQLDVVVRAKATWILERLKTASDLSARPSQREFVTGETFSYLGRPYRLRVDVDDMPRPLRREDAWLRVSVPPQIVHEHRVAFVRAALVDWYERGARERLPERAAYWSSRLGLRSPPVVVSSPRKRWGSASSNGVVRINWRVMQASPTLVDYVVAHELAHLLYPDHSRDFWAALGRVMPDYERRKARLRISGRQLDW